MTVANKIITARASASWRDVVPTKLVLWIHEEVSRLTSAESWKALSSICENVNSETDIHSQSGVPTVLVFEPDLSGGAGPSKGPEACLYGQQANSQKFPLCC